MKLNLEAMRAKLEASKSGKRNGGGSSTMWKPKPGVQQLRIVPTADGDPFREFQFHYGVGKNPGIYCNKRNDNTPCPICDFATQLWRDGVKNDDNTLKTEAKKLFAKKRYYSPVLVRGAESEGVKIWAYGKQAYEALLSYVLDPDYGDITDVEEGTDLTLTYTASTGKGSFPKTQLQPRRRPSVLCDDAVADCEELLASVPKIDDLFDRKTTEQLQIILDGYLSSDESAEESSSETSKYKKTDSSDVDKAYSDFMSAE
jgi:hypothetical protein